jgi:DNA-3-methyladenine glycosylase
MSGNKLPKEYFCRDVLEVAPSLLGKYIIRKNGSSNLKYIINEVEAYRGEEDLACHASKGKTDRNRVMYEQGGLVYVYLIYGIHWMLNIVTGEKNHPQAVLIRGIDKYSGPGRVSQSLMIDKSFYGEDLTRSRRIWIEDNDINAEIKKGPRIGIDYSGSYWSKIPWRFWINGDLL